LQRRRRPAHAFRFVTHHLARTHRPKLLIAGGSAYPGAAAQRIGLVNRAVPATQFAEAARAWAAELAALPTATACKPTCW
jgi:2-(1,2-epoxy-1,2-dihydrophenyl)acetyl-CoA isomerase